MSAKRRASFSSEDSESSDYDSDDNTNKKSPLNTKTNGLSVPGINIKKSNKEINITDLDQFVQKESRSAEFTFSITFIPSAQQHEHIKLPLGDGFLLSHGSHEEDFNKNARTEGFITEFKLEEYYNSYPRPTEISFCEEKDGDKFETKYTIFGNSKKHAGTHAIILKHPKLDNYALNFNKTYPGYTIKNLNELGVIYVNKKTVMIRCDPDEEKGIGRHPAIDLWNERCKGSDKRAIADKASGLFTMTVQKFDELRESLVKRLESSTRLTDINSIFVRMIPKPHKIMSEHDKISWADTFDVSLPMAPEVAEEVMGLPHTISGRISIKYLTMK
jgi:hypothetical protein